MRDALDRDTSMVELRALLASYEERLSRTSDTMPEAYAAQAPKPLFLINDLAVDLRSSALENAAIMDSPGIVDCFKPDEPEPFACVTKLRSGVFRVHPRQGRVSAALIGPFSGPAPSSLMATVQTNHGSAPPVRFHISTWRGEIDNRTVAALLDDPGARFLTVPPRHPGFLVSTDEDRSAPSAGETLPWGLVLATIADPPEVIDFAWADFSDILLIFPTDSGQDLRLLS